MNAGHQVNYSQLDGNRRSSSVGSYRRNNFSSPVVQATMLGRRRNVSQGVERPFFYQSNNEASPSLELTLSTGASEGDIAHVSQVDSHQIQDEHIDPEEKLFTIKLHHGGKLIEHPLKMYVGGRVDSVDFIDPDLMSLVEQDKFAEKLGYVSSAYYYLISGGNVQSGLVFLLCDDHVLKMGSIVVQFGEVSVYIVEPSFMGLLEDVIDRDIYAAYQCDNEGGGSGTKEKECDNAEAGDSGFKEKLCENAKGGGNGFKEKECENAESGDNGSKGKECDNVEDGGSGFQEKECENTEGGDIGFKGEKSDNAENAEGGDNGFKGKECDNVEDGSRDSETETDTSDEFDVRDSDYDLSEEDDILYDTHVDPEIEILAKEMDSTNIRSKGKQIDKEFHQRLFDDVEMGMGVHLESDSDCESSADELQSLCSDDEENEGGTKYIRFHPKTAMENPQFRIGMVFTSPDEFKQAVRSHAIHWQRDIVFLKNDKRRVRAKCKSTKCPWVALASKMRNSTTFQIRTLNVKHKCGRTLSKNKFVTSKLLSQKYKNDWRLNNCWRVGDFQEKVHNDLNCEISRSQYYRTKRKVNDMINGHHKDQYARLWDYTKELKRSNPNSMVVLKTDVDAKTGEEKFMRWYICFDACKRSFMEACRPAIGVDGCHLKGTHKGVILTAVGLDPNNYIFPICFCVVEGELKKSWEWFLELLVQDVGIIDQQKWTFISDRQKMLPDIEHRFCVRHMYNNFKKQHPRLALKDRLWNLARATTVNQFRFQMDSLKDFDQGEHKWISEVFPKHWSRSNFRPSPKCDILLNNIYERFNAAILEARGKPLLSMVESIRMYLMKRLQSKRQLMEKWTESICPKKDNTRSCISTYAEAAKVEKMGFMWYQKTVNCKRCGMSGHNKAKCTGSAPPPDDAPPTAAQSDPTPEAGAQPQADHIATTQPAPNVKKRKCSVCLQEEHYRSKCPTPAGRIWRNYDRYAFNFQHNPVSEEPNAPPVAPRSSGSERAAAKSRSVKEPFTDIGQST
ncbi:hypothetical protein BUALT_Bualt14G0065400 [Buddleja alternifolia]|uniref:CCHC-type domain-containing protein n=1 Tax=Buddleja alternifolia TaxID=168488 RepID=A0AAV6WIM5_9LAMI|nr:hypothetical protein BUALT_Bualt14G0065400 [Buddleja alternifolia]